MNARWVRAVVEGPGGCSAGRKEDEVLCQDDAGLALAGLVGPTVIIAIGPYRLYLCGEDTLQSLTAAIAAAYDEDRRNR